MDALEVIVVVGAASFLWWSYAQDRKGRREWERLTPEERRSRQSKREEPPQERESPVFDRLDDATRKHPTVSFFVAWGVIIVVVVLVGGQILYNISNGEGYCEGGASHDATGLTCDDWHSGTNGWWFLK